MRKTLCVFSFLLICGLGCSDRRQPTIDCLEVGRIGNDVIDGSIVLRRLVDQFGERFAREFIVFQLIDERFEEAGLTLDESVVAARLEKAQEELFFSHRGREKAMNHLAKYGIDLDDWRAQTLRRIKRDFQTNELMRYAPTEEMLSSIFEKRYGRNGERRRIRYLQVSKDPANQSLYSKEEMDSATEKWAERVQQALSLFSAKVDKNARKRLTESLGTESISFHDELLLEQVPEVFHGTLQKELQKWTDPKKVENQFTSFRRKPSQTGTLTSLSGARFEGVRISVSPEAVVKFQLSGSIVERAKLRAEKLFSQINKKRDAFKLLARRFSDHKASKARGGLFRVFDASTSRLPDSVNKKINSLSTPDQLSMIEDDIGFHIVLLEKVDRVSMTGARPHLLQELKLNTFDEREQEAYRKSLYASADVKLNLKVSERCQAKKQRD